MSPGLKIARVHRIEFDGLNSPVLADQFRESGLFSACKEVLIDEDSANMLGAGRKPTLTLQRVVKIIDHPRFVP
jgi:hypothetical protein